MRAPDRPMVRRLRGRPKGSLKDRAERMLRQTGNPNYIAADIAWAIIERHRPRDRNNERDALNRAIATGDWTIADRIMMRDTLDALMPRERRRVTHNEAIKMAIEEFKRRFPGGISKTVIEHERGMLVHKPSKRKPVARVKWPEHDKVAQIMSDRRNW